MKKRTLHEGRGGLWDKNQPSFRWHTYWQDVLAAIENKQWKRINNLITSNLEYLFMTTSTFQFEYIKYIRFVTGKVDLYCILVYCQTQYLLLSFDTHKQTHTGRHGLGSYGCIWLRLAGHRSHPHSPNPYDHACVHRLTQLEQYSLVVLPQWRVSVYV